MSKPILVIDFNNMVHRARAGFGGDKGENTITYTFFTMFRKTVETFDPSRVYIVKEGRPQERKDAFAEYKAGRTSPGDDFWRQHSDIVEILGMMPVHIVRHPHRECDDTIAHLVRNVHSEEPCVVVSSDTDFIQLLTPGNDRIRLWNPIRKVWIEPVAYDYVMWKSLTGDGSDGIPGFKGIGGKTAEKLLSNPTKLDAFLSEGDNRQIFERNRFLISFLPIEDELEAKYPSNQWEQVRTAFISRGFWSIANDKSWNKFTNTFREVQ